MIGDWPVRVSFTSRFLYVMYVTLKSPNEKIGSTESTQNCLGSVQKQTRSSSCWFDASKHIGSVHAATLLTNLSSCNLHCSITRSLRLLLVQRLIPVQLLRFALDTCIRFLSSSPRRFTHIIPPWIYRCTCIFWSRYFRFFLNDCNSTRISTTVLPFLFAVPMCFYHYSMFMPTLEPVLHQATKLRNLICKQEHCKHIEIIRKFTLC